MNRRDFMAGVVAASTVNLFLPKTFSPARWKRTETNLWVINPEWVTAEFEFRFYDMPFMWGSNEAEEKWEKDFAGFPQKSS